MATWSQVARVGLLAALTGAPTFIAAQTIYRCTNGTTSSLSDRPCDSGVRTKLSAYGSLERPRSPIQESPVGRAPEYLSYMSVPCAQLSDAIRTGPARGLRSGAMRELHDDYGKRCSDDEQTARRMWGQDQQFQKDQRTARQKAEQLEQSRIVTTKEQCHEILRILHARRKRVETYTSGQRADLERFESSYQARCAPV